MVRQDQQPVEQMGSPFHGKMSGAEDKPSTWVPGTRSWNWPFGNLRPAFRGHSHRTSLKQRGLYTVWKVEVSDVCVSL